MTRMAEGSDDTKRFEQDKDETHFSKNPNKYSFPIVVFPESLGGFM